MFIQNFKYMLKALFRNKMLIFWTFAFPIILSFFFYLAFSNIEKAEHFDAIKVAVISNDAYENNENLKQSIEYISNKDNKDRVFDTKYVSEDEASKLLENGDIDGYIIFSNENNPKVVINQNGMNQTIIKYVVEELVQSEGSIDIIKSKIQNIIDKKYENGIFKTMVLVLNAFSVNNANINNITSNNLSYTMIEYYTLIAMTCLYGGILGGVTINWCMANMSNAGKRLSITPTSKFKLIASSAFSAYIVQLLGAALLLIFTSCVLKVDYGDKIIKIIELTAIGCLSGLSMGMAITTVIKSNENIKTGLIIGITMIGCFFSGMMGITMKYIIDKNVPIINIINPANMITDGFYALYYYNTFEKFNFDVISLAIFSIVMLGISVICLRKQKFDSI